MKLDTSPEALAERLLGRPYDELDADEQRILCRIVSDDVKIEPDESVVTSTGLGDHLADVVASVGGSWPFIVVFILVIAGWMLLNSRWAGPLAQKWDLYPYEFLNFGLSLTAALQAPVIMMSQNRQSAKDRIANRHDYEINLRTTVEILELGGRVDEVMAKLDRLEAKLDRTGEAERV